MDLGLKDKIAFVAGASRGLGAAVARQLSREGARVAINARQPDRLRATAESIRRETGGEVLACPGDVTVAADIGRMIAETSEHFGWLDILVTNCGGPPPGTFDELTDDAWQKAFEAVVLSAVRLIRAALPHLRRSKAPAVLTITSYTVKQPLPNMLLSNSLRMATAGLTKSLALELGSEGIRFNSILPAFTETERVLELMADRARRLGTSVEDEINKQAAASPLGRMGSPQEFGNVAAFLCSPAAAYVTGALITVDGGMYKGMM